MVTTVLTISFSCVWRPSLVSFSAYIFGSLVGLFETKTTFAQLSQLLDEALRSRQAVVAQVDRAVEVEDVALIEPIRKQESAGGCGLSVICH